MREAVLAVGESGAGSEDGRRQQTGKVGEGRQVVVVTFVFQVRLYKVQGGRDGGELGLVEVASISGSYEVASDQSQCPSDVAPGRKVWDGSSRGGRAGRPPGQF